MKGAWLRDAPTQPGYYWVKIGCTSPEIVMLNAQGVVLRFGTNELISTYYDVKAWWPVPITFEG